MRRQIAEAKRLVVKVGSALVTNNGPGLDHDFIADCARQIAALHADGRQVLLVSSGAIAAGMQRLGWTNAAPRHARTAGRRRGRPDGSGAGLRNAPSSTTACKAAQVLLTHDDLADRTRYLNARSTLHTLLDLGVVPIINENDTVVTDEIKFGDNDTLGALVANLVEADALIILTDQQGLYSADPRNDPAATLITEGRADDRRLKPWPAAPARGIGTGGMITKVLAAKRAAKSGAHTLIVSGREPDSLLSAAAAKPSAPCSTPSSRRWRRASNGWPTTCNWPAH